MRSLLIACFLTIPIFAESHFSDVFQFGSWLAVDSIFPIGQKLTILDLEKGKILKAIVKKDSIYYDQEAEIQFRAKILNISSEKYQSSQRLIATQDSISSFSLIRKVTADSNPFPKSIHDSLISKALSRDVGCSSYLKDGVNTAIIKTIEFEGLTVYQLKINLPMITSGPVIISINGSLDVISSPCSVGWVIPFRLNDSILIYSGSTGCECGSIGYELFKLNNDKPIEIYSTWKWSM